MNDTLTLLRINGPSCKQKKQKNKPALVALVDILSTVAANSRISIHRSTTTRALQSFRRGLQDRQTQRRREVSSISKSVLRTSVETKERHFIGKILKNVPESSRRNQHTQSSSYRLLLAVGNQPANERSSHTHKETNTETFTRDTLVALKNRE